MSTIIQILNLDGYDGWNVNNVATTTVESFTRPALVKAWNELFSSCEEENISSLKSLCQRGQGKFKKNTLSCMGEEEGWIFINISN
jgi:hypothetical protein